MKLRMRQMTGRMVLAILIGFFLVIFGVNGVFAYLALETFPGVENKDAYRAGLAYNLTLRQAAAQRALGWHVAVAWHSTGRGRGRLILTLADRDGRALSDRAVNALLFRPVSAGADRAVALLERTPGRYQADVVLVAGGNWEVKIHIRRPGKSDYQIRERLEVP